MKIMKGGLLATAAALSVGSADAADMRAPVMKALPPPPPACAQFGGFYLGGQVGYSRWEHLGPVNDLKLFAMRPDCTQMRALAGQHAVTIEHYPHPVRRGFQRGEGVVVAARIVR